MSAVELEAVVLAESPAVADAVACAAALDAAAGGAAVVLRLPAADASRPWLPASRAARALAAELAAASIPAVASGRLVRAGLPAGSSEALDAAAHVTALAGGAPVVVAVCGPREDGLAALLTGARRVLAASDAQTPLGACLQAELGPRLSHVAAPGRLAALAATAGARPASTRADDGQAAQLVLAAILAVVAGAAALAVLGGALGARAERQRAADLGALAGARALLDARPRALGPVDGEGRAELTRAAYLGLARRTAVAAARANGARAVTVAFGAGGLPTRVTVRVRDPIGVPGVGRFAWRAQATAEATPWPAAVSGGGDYPGPFALRDGEPMRPDAALAYDRMARAARAAGHDLVVVSGFRSSREQARLFAARPDPKWVAPPGRSLHRLGTELDLGPASAYGWIGRNAGRFGFAVRYAWEPWHVGLVANAGTTRLGYGAPGVPAYVPAAYRPAIRDAAVRRSVGAALLAAQLQQESGFDPHARSPAGALGIAQFMPATAALYGLRDPFDARAAIDAQARLMGDLLRRFGSVPLALAAYNAGQGAVAACGCIPAITETQRYVAKILALVGGAAAGTPPVRLIG